MKDALTYAKLSQKKEFDSRSSPKMVVAGTPEVDFKPKSYSETLRTKIATPTLRLVNLLFSDSLLQPATVVGDFLAATGTRSAIASYTIEAISMERRKKESSFVIIEFPLSAQRAGYEFFLLIQSATRPFPHPEPIP